MNCRYFNNLTQVKSGNILIRILIKASKTFLRLELGEALHRHVFYNHKLTGGRACACVFFKLSGHVCALCVRSENCLPVAGLECRIAAERILEGLPAFRIGFAFLNGTGRNLFCIPFFLKKLLHDRIKK